VALSYRKRIRLAPGISLNVSKRGLGLSVGPRGAKLSVGSDGRVRGTAGRAGIRYQETLGRIGGEGRNEQQQKTPDATALRQVRQRRRWAFAIAAIVGLLVAVGSARAAVSSPSRVPAQWKNCTQVNRSYPHGIARASARDRTSGTPVTSFLRSDRLYNTATRYNRGLDRDGDGIACEKP
jgi:Protein of unknown function (DUF4236)/Excalibur calcium-binding domain